MVSFVVPFISTCTAPPGEGEAAARAEAKGAAEVKGEGEAKGGLAGVSAATV
jgi:hypothetical protein